MGENFNIYTIVDVTSSVDYSISTEILHFST